MTEIGYCGDHCSSCPRYIATIENNSVKLKETALMWKRVGWRDTVLSTDEIKCGGCKTVSWCRYDEIRQCTIDQGINNCGECNQYPCDKIDRVFEQTASYAKQCEKVFSEDDFNILSKAFFEKKKYLDHINKNVLRNNP